MNKAKKWLLNILMLMLVTGLTLYFVFSGKDFGEIVRLVSDARLMPCIAAAALVVIFILSESFIIRLLTRSVGSTSKILRCFIYSFVGVFFSGITPSASGGQPMQAYFMKKDGIPVSVSAPVLAIITVLYKGVLVLTSLAVLIIRPAVIMKYLEPVMAWMWLGLALNIVFIAALLSAMFVPGFMRSILYFGVRIYKKIFRKKNAGALMEKVDSWIDSYSGVTHCFRKKKKAVAVSFLITVLQRFALFSVTWLCCRALEVKTESAAAITMLQAMIASAVDMLPLPGGTGISESIFHAVFLPIVGDNIVIPLMIMSRGISYYSQLLWGGIFTAAAFVLYGRKKIGDSGI